MRAFGRIALSVGLAVVLAGPVLAQRGGGGGFGRGGFGMLLQNEGVQKELKLDDDTKTKVKEAVTKVSDAHKDEFAKIRDLPQDERRSKMEELSKTTNEETLKAVGDILTKDQLKRLKQIELQSEGTRAFTRAEVVKALSLTDEEKDKIKEINDDVAKQMQDLRGGGGGGNRGGNMEKIQALRKESMEKLMGVLTADQKKTWKDMTGDPFTVTFGGRRNNN
jgi:Spy/CpxP family protein refolding chaperone